MSTFQPQNTSYGLSQAIINNAPTPVPSKRNPLTSDFMQIGTIWSNITTNAVYILASITNNSANWILVEANGGVGNFSSLTVTPGPISLTGTTTINTTGTAATSIGNATGGVAMAAPLDVSGGDITLNGIGAHQVEIGISPGTGAVHIGNATGNTFIDEGELVVTDGNITLVNATSGYVLPTGCVILSGSGDPNGVAGFTAPIGSLYLNHTGSTTTNRLFVNTDGGTTWTYFTSNA